jgi:uncharacterized protein YodC (DUF2158 family)
MKVGSSVVLNSGGPKMTVEHIDGSVVKCIWFDRDQPISGKFHKACLTLWPR